MRNVLAVIADAGADQTTVAKLTIYLVEGVHVTEAYAASMPVWGSQATRGQRAHRAGARAAGVPRRDRRHRGHPRLT